MRALPNFGPKVFVAMASLMLLAGGPSMAMSVVSGPSSATGSSNFADPDGVADSMSAHLAGGAGGSMSLESRHDGAVPAAVPPRTTIFAPSQTQTPAVDLPYATR